MGKISRIARIVLLTLAICLFLAGSTMTAWAGNAAVTIDAKNGIKDDTITVGVDIKADAQPDTYRVELAYDETHLQYESGADDTADGVLVLQGTATETNIHYDLKFTCVSGGTTGLYVKDASLMDRSDDSLMSITSMANVTLTVDGEESVDNSDFMSELARVQSYRSDYAIQGTIQDASGKSYLVLDLNAEVPEGTSDKLHTMQDSWDDHTITFLTDQQGKVRLLYVLENEQPVLYALGQDNMLYPVQETEDFYYMNPASIQYWPNGLTQQMAEEEGVLYVISKTSSDSGFYKLNEEGNFVSWDYVNPEETEETGKGSSIVPIVGGIVAVVVVILIAAVLVMRKKRGTSEGDHIFTPKPETEEQKEAFASLTENMLDQMKTEDPVETKEEAENVHKEQEALWEEVEKYKNDYLLEEDIPDDYDYDYDGYDEGEPLEVDSYNIPGSADLDDRLKEALQFEEETVTPTLEPVMEKEEPKTPVITYADEEDEFSTDDAEARKAWEDDLVSKLADIDRAMEADWNERLANPSKALPDDMPTEQKEILTEMEQISEEADEEKSIFKKDDYSVTDNNTDFLKTLQQELQEAFALDSEPNDDFE